MRTPKERIIFNDYDLDDYRKYALEHIYENGYVDIETEEDDIPESLLMDVIYDYINWDWDDANISLNRFFEGKKLLVFGSIGRWNGVSTGFETFDTFGQAMDFMAEDAYNLKIYDTNGHLHVVNYHHDGRCHYEVKVLTENGIKYLERWEYAWDDKRTVADVGEKLITRYSTLPRYMEKEYGSKPREYEGATRETFKRELVNQATSYYC